MDGCFYHIIWFYYYFIYFFFSPPIHSPNDLSYVGHGFLFYLNFFILFYPHPSVLFFPIYSPNCLFHVGQGWLFNLIFFLRFDWLIPIPLFSKPLVPCSVAWMLVLIPYSCAKGREMSWMDGYIIIFDLINWNTMHS